LRHVDLAVGRGEILVILGANGAGKSVCLETIAGFHRPDAGRVVIDGRDVTALPPERRRVGFLFQNFGLFPHLTVAQNVAVALRARHEPASRDVAALLSRFGIAALADRRPELLSPGEKQRTALARALASRPDVFLFDEPFSALDPGMRESLRDELGGFLREAQVPAVFVTHDHTDALSLADRIVVMSEGAILQSGPAAEIFRRPATAFVARFLGTENILAGRCEVGEGGLLRLSIGDRLLVASSRAAWREAESEVAICIRAEDVRLERAGEEPAPSADNRLPGHVTAARPLGPLCKVTLDCGFPLTVYVMARDARESGIAPGLAVEAVIAPAAIHVLPKER
jgi:ABC-type Fe3+/spermidine/putrescine transport system ATPase subunit